MTRQPVSTPVGQDRDDGAPPPRVKLALRNIRKEFGPVVAVRNVDLSVPEGTLVSLLGPSGCGKTTTLRMVAGLERPTSGAIELDGQTLATGSSALPPEKRDIGMVFQSYALWPHMSVLENVTYGLRSRRWPKHSVESKALESLRMVGMDEYAGRYPTQLSGGQQQRIALARAVASEPSILLLDEPLSNLDAVLRESMRFEIRALQQRVGITSVYVTHSQEEALAISDALAVMSDGAIQQLGTPEEVYRRPRNRFVANFIGLANVLPGEAVGRDRSRAVVRLPGGEKVAAGVDLRQHRGDDSTVSLMVRPENARVTRASVSSTGDLLGVVDTTSYTGSIVDYFVRPLWPHPHDQLRLRIQSTPPQVVASGDEVSVSFSPDDCVILEEPTGRSGSAA